MLPRVALVAWGADFHPSYDVHIPAESCRLFREHGICSCFVDVRKFFPNDPQKGKGGKGKGKGKGKYRPAAFECDEIRPDLDCARVSHNCNTCRGACARFLMCQVTPAYDNATSRSTVWLLAAVSSKQSWARCKHGVRISLQASYVITCGRECGCCDILTGFIVWLCCTAGRHRSPFACALVQGALQFLHSVTAEIYLPSYVDSAQHEFAKMEEFLVQDAVHGSAARGPEVTILIDHLRPWAIEYIQAAQLEPIELDEAEAEVARARPSQAPEAEQPGRLAEHARDRSRSPKRSG